MTTKTPPFDRLRTQPVITVEEVPIDDLPPHPPPPRPAPPPPYLRRRAGGANQEPQGVGLRPAGDRPARGPDRHRWPPALARGQTSRLQDGPRRLAGHLPGAGASPQPGPEQDLGRLGPGAARPPAGRPAAGLRDRPRA